MINIDDRIFEQVKDENQMWLLLHIAKRINKDMSCFPKNFTLEKDCGWGKNKVQKVKKELKQLGLIDVMTRMVNGQQRANNYKVTTDYIGVFVSLRKLQGALFEGSLKQGTPIEGMLNEGTLEQGNRSINHNEVLTQLSIKDKKGDKQNLSTPLLLNSEFDQFKEVLRYLTEKSGNRFRLGNEAKVKKSDKYKKITARLKEYSIDDLKAVIDVKCKEWGDSAEWCKRLVPKTLFCSSNFERYLDEAENKDNNPAIAKNATTPLLDTYTLPPALQKKYETSLAQFNLKPVAQRITYFTKQQFQSWMKGGSNFEKHRNRGILTEQKIYKKITNTINRLNASSFDQKITGCLVDFVELAFSNKVKQLG